MRVALIHSRYSQLNPSGENIAVDLQLEELNKAGFVAELFSRSTDEEVRKPFFPLVAAKTTALGIGGSLLPEVRKFKPDIVHVHNLFPNLGWTWLSRIGVPIIATLHNFRTFCAAGTAMYKGQKCLQCQENGSSIGVRRGCYRGSSLETIPLAVQTRKNINSHPLLALSSGIVFLSARQRDVFEEIEFQASNSRVIPNFVPKSNVTKITPTGRWVWIGRISEEKGLRTLLNWWPRGYGLDVIGDGPLYSELAALSNDNIMFLGKQSQDEIRRTLSGYSGVVISSEWHEAAVNMVHLDALKHRLPVIAREGSTSADELRATGLGQIYDSREQLEAALQRLSERPISKALIYARYQEEFSPEVWRRKMGDFYRETIGN